MKVKVSSPHPTYHEMLLDPPTYVFVVLEKRRTHTESGIVPVFALSNYIDLASPCPIYLL